ncbi:hypothetical protein [Brevibacterium luteolum]|uniref:Uncharacterized protein n=1 Tax=Brevibacterium luteolum TaxID=199591 RepID=A0A2N6PHV7_9MICO|nr:hypothetical protein [Brevibacterium luteolum]PMB98259.1 hypothetical protein CJ198_07810 [Brevibacterium luteolum]
MKGTGVTLDGGGFSTAEDGTPVIGDCLLALTGHYAAAVFTDGTLADAVAEGGQRHALRLVGGPAGTLPGFGHDGTRAFR